MDQGYSLSGEFTSRRLKKIVTYFVNTYYMNLFVLVSYISLRKEERFPRCNSFAD